MSDRHDPVGAAFDALRADTRGLDAMEPLRTVTSRRRSIVRRGSVLGAAVAAVIVVLGFVFLRDGGGDDVVAGSRSAEGDGSLAADPGSLSGSSWTLVAGSGHGAAIPIVDGWPITLVFSVDATTLGGTAACNAYGSGYSIDGENMAIRELSSTATRCDGPVMESESSYLSALGDVDAISLLGDELSLRGPVTELSFRRNTPVPVAELVDQLWLLDTLIEGETVSSVRGDPATLLLNEDGTVIGSTGCRTLSGEYVVSGNEVLFTTFGAEGECSSQLRDQDNLVVTVLGDGFTAEVDGQRLTVTAAGNEGLGYVAITGGDLVDATRDPAPSDGELLAGTSWVLIQGEGPAGQIDIVAGFEPRISFAGDGDLSGTLSCNGFAAETTLDANRLRVGELAPDRATCDDPGVMEAEAAFTAALRDVTEFAIEGEGEVLVMTGTVTEMVFELTGGAEPDDSASGAEADDVTRLFDERPDGTTTVRGVAIDSGGGWILCDRADSDRFLGCGGRWVTVTNFEPTIDLIGPGSWDGALTDDDRFAISGRDADVTATADQLARADAFANLTSDGSIVDAAELRVAGTVLLGLGDQLVEERTATQLTEAANWQLSLEAFRGRVGPFSAAEILQQADGIEVIVGPHDHCASPPRPISEQIIFSAQLSLQPTGIDSCIEWFAVDLFLNDAGEVAAITLELFEP